MSNAHQKIIIPRPLLDRLKASDDMKAVISHPDTHEQDISMLVSPTKRVFACWVLPSPAKENTPGAPDKVLIGYEKEDIDRIKKVQQVVQENGLQSAEVSTFFNAVGIVDCTAYDAAAKVSSRFAHITGQDISYIVASDYSNELINTDTVAINLITKTYPPENTMSYQELIRSECRLFVVESVGADPVELAADVVDSDCPYKLSDPHPEYGIELWQSEVVNLATDLGYSNWVQQKIGGTEKTQLATVVTKEVELIGIDLALRTATCQSSTGLFRVIVGEYDFDAQASCLALMKPPLKKEHVVIVSVTDAVKNTNPESIKRLACGLVSGDQSNKYAPIGESVEILSSRAIDDITAFIREYDGDAIEAVFNKHTSMKVKCCEHGIVDMDGRDLVSVQLSGILLKYFCGKPSDQVQTALDDIRAHLEDNAPGQLM